MKLNYCKFQRVIDDLEDRGFVVTVIAYVNEQNREYTIEAKHPSGKRWEIVKIE